MKAGSALPLPPAVQKTRTRQPAASFCRYWPVLRLLLFLVMLLAPDFPDSDAPGTSLDVMRPVFDQVE
jgi:hypothetical protein